MDSNEARLGIVIAICIMIVITTLLWTEFYSTNIVALKMAEKGLCWTNNISRYQPCEVKK